MKLLGILIILFSISSCIESKTELDFAETEADIDNQAGNGVVNTDGSNNGTNGSNGGIDSNPEVITGANLYRINCSGCHGVRESSTKRYRDFHQIKNAINAIPAMNKVTLKALTDQEITQIAQALNVQDNTPIDTERLDVSLRIGGRRYVESVFLQVFDTAPDEDSLLKSQIHRNGEFGGACDYYAAAATGYTTAEFPRQRCYSGLKEVLPANYTAARSAFSSNMCERFITRDSTFTKAMSKVTSFESGWSDQNFIKLYQLFYLLEDPSSNVISKFKNLFESQSNNKDGWKSVMLGVCLSPEWQVL